MLNAPLIGITTGRETNSFGTDVFAISEAYSQAVAQAGGIPVMIPLVLDGDQIRALMPSLDGILLSGGGDVEPQQYGSAPTAKVKYIDPDRDRVELTLVESAIANGIPFLGICRGIQVLNVALGGTLFTDIAELLPNALKHDYFPDWPRDHLAHEVQIQPDTLLERILAADTIQVNSLHHQGIDHLAPDLEVIARAPDGLVEAVVLLDHPFGLAVQWHPENLTAHAPFRAFFRAFVAAAGEYRA
jgi:putative glutamine amidotransferase